jgi:hypothetical protein
VALIGVGLAIAADFGINALTAVLNNLPGLVGPIIDQVTATIRLISTVLTEVITAVQAAINGDWNAVWESAKTVINEFGTFFSGLFQRLGTLVRVVVAIIYDAVTNTLKDMGVDITPTLEGIRKTFEDIWGAIQGTIQGVIDIVGNVTDAFSTFKSFLDGLQLRNPFTPLVDAYNTIAGGIAKIGTEGGMDNNPATPWAGGTSYFPGGMGTINERGYEEIILPAGSRILTNGQTNQQQPQGTQVTINMGGITVRSEQDAHYVVDRLRDALVGMGA